MATSSESGDVTSFAGGSKAAMLRSGGERRGKEGKGGKRGQGGHRKEYRRCVNSLCIGCNMGCYLQVIRNDDSYRPDMEGK